MQEVEAQMAAKAAQVQQTYKSEMMQLSAAASTQLDQLTAVLQDKAEGITGLQEHFQKQLNAAWEDYTQTYGQVEAFTQVSTCQVNLLVQMDGREIATGWPSDRWLAPLVKSRKGVPYDLHCNDEQPVLLCQNFCLVFVLAVSQTPLAIWQAQNPLAT